VIKIEYLDCLNIKKLLISFLTEKEKVNYQLKNLLANYYLKRNFLDPYNANQKLEITENLNFYIFEISYFILRTYVILKEIIFDRKLFE
jgi:hypothetical protein